MEKHGKKMKEKLKKMVHHEEEGKEEKKQTKRERAELRKQNSAEMKMSESKW